MNLSNFVTQIGSSNLLYQGDGFSEYNGEL